MLEKLKEYKEIITLVVFFLGGFFWVQNQYPSKSDLKAEVASLRCLLDNYMKLTQLQMLSQDQEKQLFELKRKLSDPDSSEASGSSLSPALRLELEQLHVEYSSKVTAQQKTIQDMSKIRDELARGVCVR
jgi:hypothetical protein